MATRGSSTLTQAVLRRQRLQPGRDYTLLAVTSEQDHEFQRRTVHWIKEEQAKDHSSDRGKNKWHREIPSSGYRQTQGTPCFQEQENFHQVQGKLKSVNVNENFRKGVACVGHATRPKGTQSAAVSR